MTSTKAERIRMRYERRYAELAGYASLDGSGTAFVGDSLVQNARWSELLPREPSRNFGVKSDTAHRMFERCEGVAQVAPARIVVLIGTNDISRGGSATVTAWIARCVEVWRDRMPDVSIALLAVPPREPSLADQVRALNHELATYAAGHGLGFLDETAVLLGDEGGLDPRWASDALHLNKAGYAQWMGRLRPRLRSLGIDVRPAGPPEALVLAVAQAIAAEEDYDWGDLGSAEQAERRHQAACFLIASETARVFARQQLDKRSRKPAAKDVAPAAEPQVAEPA